MRCGWAPRLGVLHAGSAGHLPELRKHAESTYRQHAAVAGDIESLVRTAWANYAKQVEGPGVIFV